MRRAGWYTTRDLIHVLPDYDYGGGQREVVHYQLASAQTLIVP
jgi:hypothetical protein